MGIVFDKIISRVILLISNSVLSNISDYNDKELYDLIVIRNGGMNTMRIIDEILMKPQNANQIAKRLGLNYKTVTYHLDLICNHNYATKENFDKHYSYFPSDKLVRNLEEYNKIQESMQSD